MGYGLGVDLGTTFTAAAVERDGRVEMATLGDRTAAVPSVVLLRGDGTVLTGDAADRRAASEPDRVAREVKRRLGDPMPVLLGGAPQPVQELMAMQLRDVVRVVAEREGGAPEEVTLTHPANWGPYKKELFGQIPRRAGIDRVRMLTEPEAAAAHYASTERVPDGAVVAVYDLGGGTFDATVLRTTGDGFEILGTPEGIEGLGGIDFDEAVYAHVDRALDGALSELDPADVRATASAIRLRHECVLAKEALSADTEATIPVLLPALQTEVRLTRGEFETMIQPSIAATVEAMRRALRSAGVTPEELHTVLLVGGSSRIPAVARMVSAELGRPTSVDAHPKHAIALGAASLSGRTGPAGVDHGGPADDSPTPPRGIPVVTPMGAPIAAPGGPAGAPGVPIGPGTPPGGVPRPTGPTGTGTLGATPAAATAPMTAPLGAMSAGGQGPTGGTGTLDPAAATTPAADGAPLHPEAGAPPPELRAPASARRKRRVGVTVGAGIIVAAAAVGAALFYGTAGGTPTTPGPAAATSVAPPPPAPTTEEAAPQDDDSSSGNSGSGTSPKVKKTTERPEPKPVEPVEPGPDTNPEKEKTTEKPSTETPPSSKSGTGDGGGWEGTSG